MSCKSERQKGSQGNGYRKIKKDHSVFLYLELVGNLSFDKKPKPPNKLLVL